VGANSFVDEPYDLIIIGGGFAGLIAAYEFRKARPNSRCLVLDNHPVFGGEAKQNQMLVDGVMLTGPQGSNDAIVPRADNNYAHVAGLWDEIGMPRAYDFIDPAGAAKPLKFARDNYNPMYWNEDSASVGYFFDTPFASKRAWVVDPWSDDLRRAPIPLEARRNWLQWKKYSPVLTRGDEAATDRWLDSMSYGDLIVRELGLSKDVFRLSDPLVATGDYGVSSDAVSAYGAKLLGLPGTGDNILSDDTFSFPGGNAAILRHIVKALLPDAITGTSSFADVLYAPIDFGALDRPQHTRIRLGATAVAVRHDGKPDAASGVNVTYAVGEELARVRGKAVIVQIRRQLQRMLGSAGMQLSIEQVLTGKFGHPGARLPRLLALYSATSRAESGLCHLNASEATSPKMRASCAFADVARIGNRIQSGAAHRRIGEQCVGADGALGPTLRQQACPPSPAPSGPSSRFAVPARL
jgi:spermidine dehydrogenase